MLTFSQPGWLALLVLFPTLVILRHFWKRRGGRLPFPHRIWGGEGFDPPQTGIGVLLVVADVLTWFGAALLVVAMAGPMVTHREEVLLSRGIDIIIVLDQSPSMAAEDFPPTNRFDTAREMIRRFVEGRDGDSVGLVSFGGEAVLRSPPTADYGWLVDRLNALQIRTLGDETAIGMGLAVATLHLSDSTASEKVILLLTDGDNNAGEIQPDTAASLAAGKGIRIYCIGIGAEGEATVELTDPETGAITRGLIRTRFDEELLRRIAETTGGGYWRAASPGALETVFLEVDSLEAVEKRVSLRVSQRRLHRGLILIGFALVVSMYLFRKGILGEIP